MIKKKILIVDDEPDIAETIRFKLESEGYHCSVSNNGYDAVEKVHKDMPDLIILDVRLPKKNGYQVCRLLKFDEEYKHIPIFMLTARTQPSDKMLGKYAGANAYITKPFKMEILLKYVNGYLQKA